MEILMAGVSILIPAAGFGRRMRGADKLMMLVDDVPLLRRQTQHACAVSDRVIVTVPDLMHPRAQVISDLPAQCIAVPDAAQGMSASLRAGARLAATGDGLMIVPADMPDLSGDDFCFISSSFLKKPDVILQATSADGTPGHPVVFPHDLIAELLQLSGDEGARSVLRAHQNRVRKCALPDQRAVTDLDTPEAWSAWRISRRMP